MNHDVPRADGAALPVRSWLVCGLAGWLGLIAALAAEPAKIQFNRDIRPLLAENCLACHGPDPGARKAGLRLDTREGLFEPGAKRGPVVQPGDLAKSDLWRRVITTDADDLMPPAKSNKKLTPEQKELLRQWILAGAPWQGHWAYVKPERPALPAVRQADWARNPIDRFVLARLQDKGLEPAPEAEARVLARRVALDLTGLPPEPAEVERFLRDRSPDAYERYVARLLASPHYGEHRARYWLDAARYADTHGLHFDNYREIWPYRDWVIQAFNRNEPYDQFIIDQIAGDLLPNPTDDQLVATGFQRCNVTTNEGGTIEEENLANYANDRVTTTGWVFLGTTVNCAACHDHKFDPFTMRDFYSLAAFFRNTKQGGYDRNRREGEVSLMVPQTPAERERWKALPFEIEAARKAQTNEAFRASPAFTNWLARADAARAGRQPDLGPAELRLPLDEGRGSNVTARLDGKRATFAAPAALEWRRGLLGPAPVLRKDRGVNLGDLGDLNPREPFTLAAWVFVPEGAKDGGAILARMGGEEERFRGWDFFVRDEQFGIHMINNWPSVALKVASQEKVVKRGDWHHLVVSYDGSTRADGVTLYCDGIEVGANRERDSLEGPIHSHFPLRLGQREKGDKLDGVAVQDVRVFGRRLDPAEAGALAAAPRLPELLARVDLVATNNPAREALRGYFNVTQEPAWRQATGRLLALEGESQSIRSRSPFTHIQQEKPNSEPFAHILNRGQYDQPRDKVTAATPAALHAFPAGAPRNRLGLARWLVDPENPLTARVTVNRFWQEVFGVGLVKTAEDFGVTGERPVNPALLDWLALEFQESGWDVKRLLTLMVTSSAYRQSAVTTPAKLERDPDNRLLSRGPRFRMDAEMLRDYALAAGGLLAPRIGGPSVRVRQPVNVWEAVAMPESNTRYYEADTGDALHRRSLYTFWKRAAPPPVLDVLNAPSREVCTVRRERTNTPLQALVTLNDLTFFESAGNLARLACSQAKGAGPDAVAFMAARVLGRPLTAAELEVVNRTLDGMAAFYREHPDEARQVLRAGDPEPSQAAQAGATNSWRFRGMKGMAAQLEGGPLPPGTNAGTLAALTLVANQLLNLDEALSK